MGTGRAMTRVPVRAHREPTTRPTLVVGDTSPYLGYMSNDKRYILGTTRPTLVVRDRLPYLRYKSIDNGTSQGT